jgi:hypothetical protein
MDVNRLGVCGLLLFASCYSFGQTIYGQGTESCGKWVELRRQDDMSMYMGYVAWAQGFIANSTIKGMDKNYLIEVRKGVGNSRKSDIKYKFKKYDYYALVALLDNACRADPTQKFYEAVDSISHRIVSQY